MATLRLYLLGAPRIERDDEPVHIERRRALALFLYLAATVQPHTRDALTALFWPEAGQSAGRANLRRALYAVGQALGPDWLSADEDAVCLSPAMSVWTDTGHFRRLLDSCRSHPHPPDQVCAECVPLLRQAIELYRDDFLAGFSLPDAPDFDAWQFFTGEELRQQASTALERLVRGSVGVNDYAQAVGYAQRWLAMDPLHEPAHRQLMLLYAQAGRQAAALRQYEQCAQILAQELDVAPAPETQELAAAIRARRAAPLRTQVARQADGVPAAPSPQEEIHVVTAVAVTLAETTPAGAEQADPLDALAAAASRLDTIVARGAATFGARLERLVAEDSLLLFGVDQVREDDAEAALRAAWAVQEEAHAQGLAVRIGANTGLAYCRRQGDDVAVLGAAVSLATRLRNRAGADEILVGRGTYLAARGLCDYAMRTLAVPGLADPVPAYQALRLRSRPRKMRGIEGLPAALVGRDPEMALLRTALSKAAAGQGQVIAIVGDAGVGKSRLVAELERYSKFEIRNSNLLWLEGRGAEHATGTAYWLFVDMLRGLLAADAAEAAALDGRLSALLGRLQADGRLTPEDVQELAPMLGRLLSLRMGDAADERLVRVDAEQLRHRTFGAVQRLVAALASIQPLALVFEDLHWADALSLDLIGELLALVQNLPMMLVCVYRLQEAQLHNLLAQVARRRCPGSFTELHVQPLSPAESRQMVAALLAVEQLTDPVREQILERAQGNPLFLEEIVRSLIDSGAIWRTGQAWLAQPAAGPLALPTTVQSIVLGRMDRLPADAKQVAQMAALLGRFFAPRLVAAMAPPTLDMQSSLRHLLDHRLVYQERSLPEPEYSFSHVLVRDAIYQALPRSRRAETHRLAGLAIEAAYGASMEAHVEALAHHFEQSQDHDKAVAYLLRAGQKAQAAYLNQEAIGYYQRALARLDQATPGEQASRWRLAALTGLGQVYQVIGEFDRSQENLRAAIALGRALPAAFADLIRLYFWLGDLLLVQDAEASLAIGLEGLALAGEGAETVDAAMMLSIVGWSYFFLGQVERFKDTAFRAARFLMKLPHSPELRPAYGMVGEAYYYDKSAAQAAAWGESVRELARQHQDLRLYGESAYNFVHAATGDTLEKILRVIDQCRAQMERVGDRRRINWADLWAGSSSLMFGALDQAQDYLARALPVTMELNRHYVPHILRLLGCIHLAQGRKVEAIATLQKACAQYGEATYHPAECRVALAFAHLANQDRAAAAGHFRSALQSMADPNFSAALGDYRIHTWSLFADALSGLESTLADPAAYDAWCTDFRQAHPAARSSPFAQWRLEPATPQTLHHTALVLEEPFAAALADGWSWVDSVGDVLYLIDDGLTVWTPNQRDLWHAYLTAPRLLRPVTGDWMAEVLCTPAAADRPAIGGLLLWQDKRNYLRLDHGTRGGREVALQGCVNDRELVFGRGQLDSQATILRLERSGSTVRGLCSADGAAWLSVGQVDFPADGPLEVGVFASGMIQRLIYPAAYPDGTAIRFQRFRLWRGS